ncbi:MAG: bifunctional serine/threonine-protein kinase/formylglycine-generating enzyme family protein [Planctomycetota bacterium]
MDVTLWQRAESVLDAALAVGPADRGAVIAAACAGDEQLEEAVETLLREDDAPGADPAPEDLSGTVLGGYELVARIGSGATGVVYRARQGVLDREVALKVLRARRRSGGTAGPSWSQRERFVATARMLARLDHSGIVTLHDLQTDGERVFFTMELVKGQDFGQIAAAVRRRDRSLRSALLALLQACHAIEAAHHHLLHRDLKPAHIRYAKNGVVKVVDWGAALPRRAAARKRPGPSDASAASGDDFDQLRDVLVAAQRAAGTRPYMAPEQERGEPLSPATDVYSIGVILYQLVTGHPSLDGELDYGDRWRLRVRGAPRELVSICAVATHPKARKRYQSMSALADDLERFLAGEVVSAHPIGLLGRFAKLSARHRRVTAAATVVLAVIVGLVAYVGITTYQHGRTEALLLASALPAEVRGAREELSRIESQLPPEEWEMGHAAALASWLQRYESLGERVVSLATTAPATFVLPRTARAHQGHDDQAWLERRRVDLQDRIRANHVRGSRFDRAAAIQRAQELERVEKQLRWLSNSSALANEGRAPQLSRDLLAFPPRLREVREDLEWARGARRMTVEQWAEDWDRAIAAVGSRDAYGGLELPAQVGLVPLGEDPGSGLQEFWHPRSGAKPTRGTDGRLRLDAESGLVFVLVPPGTFIMGTDRKDSSAQPGPVTLTAFFLSKYEMTQGQWERLSHGERPSRGEPHPLHPVDAVSWDRCRRLLRRHGLVLPTEAQWEYACRGGTATEWWAGAHAVVEVANLADETARAAGAKWPALDRADGADGYVQHAPVDELLPNPYGLHHIQGNVWEWCRDWFNYYDVEPRRGDGLRPGADRPFRINRGGGFDSGAASAERSARNSSSSDTARDSIGLRPARPVVSAP